MYFILKCKLFLRLGKLNHHAKNVPYSFSHQLDEILSSGQENSPNRSRETAIKILTQNTNKNLGQRLSVFKYALIH